MWGVDSGALESIIAFFYSGQCSLTFPSAVAVMDAANRLDVPSLSAAANSYVREALTVQTASTILSYSLQFKLADLTNTCLELVNSRCGREGGGHRAGTSRAAAPPSLGTAAAWLVCPSHLGAHPGAPPCRTCRPPHRTSPLACACCHCLHLCPQVQRRHQQQGLHTGQL